MSVSHSRCNTHKGLPRWWFPRFPGRCLFRCGSVFPLPRSVSRYTVFQRYGQALPVRSAGCSSARGRSSKTQVRGGYARYCQVHSGIHHSRGGCFQYCQSHFAARFPMRHSCFQLPQGRCPRTCRKSLTRCSCCRKTLPRKRKALRIP